MTSRDFVYWLQGYFELQPLDTIPVQWQIDKIKRHLNMVFHHEIDPGFGKDLPDLKKIHDPPLDVSAILDSLKKGFDPGGKINC